MLQRVAACCSVFRKEAPVTNQCVAAYFSVLQCVLQYAAECCSVLQCAAVCCSVLQCVAVCCSTPHCNTFICVTGATVLKLWCNTLHQTAPHCNKLQHVQTCDRDFCFCTSSVKRCNTLQHTQKYAATYCNTLQHIYMFDRRFCSAMFDEMASPTKGEVTATHCNTYCNIRTHTKTHTAIHILMSVCVPCHRRHGEPDKR